MKRIIKIPAIILFLYSLSLASAEKSELQNYITISGSSNVSHFSIEHTQFRSAPIIVDATDHSNANDSLFSSAIIIPVRDFECQNPLMKRDFIQLLKTDQHPDIKISFIPKPKYSNSNSTITVALQINIAGHTHYDTLNCEWIDQHQTEQWIQGQATLKLSDFNIIPPKKFFGTVIVKDKFYVYFRIKAQRSAFALDLAEGPFTE